MTIAFLGPTMAFDKARDHGHGHVCGHENVTFQVVWERSHVSESRFREKPGTETRNRHLRPGMPQRPKTPGGDGRTAEPLRLARVRGGAPSLRDGPPESRRASQPRVF